MLSKQITSECITIQRRKWLKQDYHATTTYLKQCRYSIRLRFRSSSLIPVYRKRIKRRRLEIASCGFGFIKDRLAESRPTWRSDLVDSPSPVRASVCQSRRCVSSTSFLGRAGACCCSVPMKLLTASGGLHLIGILDNSRWKECSILRAVVYDLDKLAFARFQHEKRTDSEPLIVTTNQLRLI